MSAELTELVELRKPNCKVFRHPDGRHEYHIWATRVHYLDRDTHRLEDVSTDIEGDETVPGFHLSLRRMPYRLRLGPSQWCFGFGEERHVTYRPLNCLEVLPSLGPQDVTYPDLWPSVDVRLYLCARGVREEIVLKDSAAPSTFAFDVSGAKGIRLAEGAKGIEVRDKAGILVGVMPRPFAQDHSGREISVQAALEGSTIKMLLDERALDSAVYPITIDPIIQPGPEDGIDTYVQQTQSSGNYGTSPQMIVGRSADGLFLYRSLIRFDLSALPEGEGVSAASMYLRFFQEEQRLDCTINAHEITGDWSEDEVTWSSQPSYDSAVAGSSVISSAPPVTESWTIASLCREWRRGSKANRGMLLKVASEVESGTRKDFRSSDYTTTPTERPKLSVTTSVRPIVVLSSPLGTPANPTVLQNTAVLSVSAAYNSGAGLAMYYKQVQIRDARGVIRHDTGKVQASCNPAQTFYTSISPFGWVHYGELCRVRVMAWDLNGGYSTWSSEGWFKYLLTGTPGPTDLAAGDRLLALTNTGRVIVLQGDTDLGNVIQGSGTFPINVQGLDLAAVKKVFERYRIVYRCPVGNAIRIYTSVRGEDLGDGQDWQGPHTLETGQGILRAELPFPVVPSGKPRSEFFRIKLELEGPNAEALIIDTEAQVSR